MMWLNKKTGVLSTCEQLQPVLDENEKMIRGHLLDNGDFQIDPYGPDILHESIPDQVCYEDDDKKLEKAIQLKRPGWRRTLNNIMTKVLP